MTIGRGLQRYKTSFLPELLWPCAEDLPARSFGIGSTDRFHARRPAELRGAKTFASADFLRHRLAVICRGRRVAPGRQSREQPRAVRDVVENGVAFAVDDFHAHIGHVISGVERK